MTQARSHHTGHDLSVLPCALPARHLLAAGLIFACLTPSPAEAAITVDPNGVGHDDVAILTNDTRTMLNSVPGDLTLSGLLVLGETSIGDLLVNDGSSLTSEIQIGHGDLTIESGGSVSTSRFAAGIIFGINPDLTPALATATVTGEGSKWEASNSLVIGSIGNGILNIEHGGLVAVAFPRGGLIGSDGGTGVLNVSGAGSTWTSGRLHIGNETSNGTLNIHDGGLVEAEFFNVDPDNGTLNWTNGTIRVSGTPFTNGPNLTGFNSPFTNALIIGENAGDQSTLELISGATHSSSSGFIGFENGAIGTVTLRGAGSSWNSGTTLEVGFSGTGFLNIQEGASVTNTNGSVGSTGSGAGTATVQGSGSTWTSTGTLTVGSTANGVVQVQDGGRVIAGGAGGITVNSLGALNVVGGGVLESSSIVIDGGRFNRDAAGEVTFATDGTVMTVRNNGLASIAGDFTLAANRTISLESGGDWNNNGDFTAEGTFHVDSGTTLNGSPNAAPTGAAGSAGNTLNTSGALNVDGAVLFNGGAGGPGSVPNPPFSFLFGPGGHGAAGGVLNATDGAVDLNGSAVMRFDGGAGGSTGGTAFGGNGGNGGTINISGAAVTLNDSSTLSASGGIGGAGLMAGTGGAGGALNLNSGSLIQNGSSSVHLLGRDVLFDISTGGTLNLLGGDYTINDNATLDLRAGQGIGSAGETINITSGTFQMNGGTVFANTVEHPGTGAFNLDGGALHVEDFNGTLEQNGGTLVPGNSPGTTTITGDYNLSAGTVAIELAGLTPGTQHDAVLVGGALTLGAGSILDVTPLGSFSPGLGNVFNVLDFTSVNGTFGTVNLPGLANGMTWDQSQLYTDGSLLVISGLSGDYNNDGVVDIADYTVWRDNLNGQAGTLLNDTTGVAIGQPQYDAWRANFGAMLPPPAAAIPEPAAAALLLIGLGSRARAR